MPPPPSENNFLRKDDEAGKFVKRGKTPATEEEDNNLPDNEDDPLGAQFQANGGDQASPPMESMKKNRPKSMARHQKLPQHNRDFWGDQ